MRLNCYLTFSLAELALQPREVAEAMLAACRRHAPARLMALCQLEDRFLAICHPLDSPEEAVQEIQVDCLLDPTPEAMLALLRQRDEGGYSPVGSLSDSSGEEALRRFLVFQR